MTKSEPIVSETQDTTSDSSKALDVLVHRLRHLDYIPRGIVCLKAIPVASSDSSEKDDADRSSLLAIAREGGEIQLIDTAEKYRTIATVPGMPSRDIGNLTWIVPPGSPSDRKILIGASSTDGTLFVVNYHQQRHTGVIHPGGGAILALETIHHGDQHEHPPLLAVGCEDGSIRIVSYHDNGSDEGTAKGPTLELVSTIMATSSVLSLAWWKNTNQANGTAGLVGYLYAGCADGTIRRLDCLTGSASKSGRYSWKPSARTTAETQGSTTPTRIWSLLCLNDPSGSYSSSSSSHTIVSGTSIGQVQFWESSTLTLVTSFEQNEHQASVLTLATNESHTKVFASGVDPRVVCLSRIANKNGDSAWIATEAYRPHTHQIQSLAMLPRTSSSINQIMVSGGVDTKLCTYLVTPASGGAVDSAGATKKHPHRPRHLRLWPGNEGKHPVHIAKKRGVVAVLRQNDQAVDLYRLASTDQPGVNAARDSWYVSPQRLLNLKIQTPYNLSCMALSSDGTILAVNDASGTMLFYLSYVSDNAVEAKRIETSQEVDDEITYDRKMCCCMKFSHDGQYLVCATSEGPVLVYDIVRNDEENSSGPVIELAHVFTEHMSMTDASRNDETSTKSSFLYPFTRLDVSSNGRWLVAGRNVRGIGAVHVFAFPRAGEAENDSNPSFSHWWCVPTLSESASHSCVRFAGDALIVACVDNTFYILDVETRSLSDWSQDMGVPPTKTLPVELIQRADYPISVTMNPASSSQFLLVSYRDKIWHVMDVFTSRGCVDNSLFSKGVCRCLPCNMKVRLPIALLREP